MELKGYVAMIQNDIVTVQNEGRSHSYSTPYDSSMSGLAVGDSVTFNVVKNQFGIDAAANIRKVSS